MKVDIIFLVNHFRKDGEGFFFSFFISIIFLYTKRGSDKRTSDAKASTLYQNEIDNLILHRNFLERPRF